VSVAAVAPSRTVMVRDGHELTVGSVDVLPHAASSMAPVSIARRNGRIAPF